MGSTHAVRKRLSLTLQNTKEFLEHTRLLKIITMISKIPVQTKPNTDQIERAAQWVKALMFCRGVSAKCRAMSII